MPLQHTKNEKFVCLDRSKFNFSAQQILSEFDSNIDLEILSIAFPEGLFNPKLACLFN